MTKTFIYVLKDPESNEVRYVGKTSQPKTRLFHHVSISKGQRNPREVWIHSLVSRNTPPVMEVIEECSQNDSRERECFWIDYFKQAGEIFNSRDETWVERREGNLIRLDIMVTDNQEVALKQAKQNTGLTMSDLIRRALDKYLEEVKDDHRTKVHST